MGCDIHIYTEIKMTLRTDREGTQITQWFPADAYFPNPYVEMGIKDPYSCAFEGLACGIYVHVDAASNALCHIQQDFA